MIGAIVRNNIVENLIVINENQIAPMSQILGCEIVDARPYGLVQGDLKTDKGWTRNAGGEQMILPLLEQQAYDSYTIASNKVIELEQQQELVAENAANEALAILNGEEI